MRTDLKVGISVGILAVISVAVYYAVFASPSSIDANNPGEVARDANAGKDKTDGGPSLPAFNTLAARAGKGAAEPPPPAIHESSPTVRQTPPIRGIVDTPPPSEPAITPAIRETPPAQKPEPVVATKIHEEPAPKIADVPPAPAKIIDTSPVTDAPPAPKITDTPPAPEPVVAPTIREETPKIADVPLSLAAAPSPVLAAPASEVVTPTIRETPPAPKAVEPPVTPVIEDAPPLLPKPVVPVAPVAPVAGAPGAYEVQKGDSGFWAIAEKVYGDGRLWPLIAKANPSVDSNALKPGVKLTIPPKPGAAPARGAGASAAAAPPPAGEAGTYVVQKGDAGFWGIAQKLYGSGKYWTVIAAANPKVSSSTLKAGDKLVAPPKSALPTTAPAGVGTAGGIVDVGSGTGGQIAAPTSKPAPMDVTPAPGQKVYTVQKGDAGFWGIAQKVYGDGKYWPLIAKANPTVMSGSLRQGQQMVYPELTESMRSDFAPRGPTSRPAGATSRAASPTAKPPPPSAPRPPRGGAVEDSPRPVFD
jgi:nucleoid-associated protein YgaU